MIVEIDYLNVMDTLIFSEIITLKRRHNPSKAELQEIGWTLADNNLLSVTKLVKIMMFEKNKNSVLSC